MPMDRKYFEADDVERYANLLRGLKARMRLVTETLQSAPQNQPNAELIAVQLRIVLELVVLGSLITHRNEIGAVVTALHKKNAREARMLARRVNPAYWPKPVEQFPAPSGRLKDVTEGYLTEAEWGPAYGFLSDLLHAKNPYRNTVRATRDLGQIYQRLADLYGRIVVLTGHHWIYPLNRDHALAADIYTDADVRVRSFRRKQFTSAP